MQNVQNSRSPQNIRHCQTKVIDMKRLPTAIKINDQWVLPRGGTVATLMSKGYIPSSTDPNVFIPNLQDKRYKPHRQFYYMAPLVTFPSAQLLDIGMRPRQPTFRDPFADVIDPLRPKYTPIPGAGLPGIANPNAPPGGPLLLPPGGAPGLNNSPFAPGIGARGQVAPGLNPPAGPQVPPQVPQPQQPVDPNDPFANKPTLPSARPFNPADPATLPGTPTPFNPPK